MTKDIITPRLKYYLDLHMRRLLRALLSKLGAILISIQALTMIWRKSLFPILWFGRPSYRVFSRFRFRYWICRSWLRTSLATITISFGRTVKFFKILPKTLFLPLPSAFSWWHLRPLLIPFSFLTFWHDLISEMTEFRR